MGTIPKLNQTFIRVTRMKKEKKTALELLPGQPSVHMMLSPPVKMG